MDKHSFDSLKPYAAAERISRKLILFGVEFAIALFGVLRELFASMESHHDEERRLHDSDLSGEFNHRTGRLDAGTDPHGWYDD